MYRVTQAQALSGYRLRLRFQDGAEGEVDLSHLAGRGVFAKWDDPGEFEKVSLTSGGTVAWGVELDLCPDALYMRMTGKNSEQIFSSIASRCEP